MAGHLGSSPVLVKNLSTKNLYVVFSEQFIPLILMFASVYKLRLRCAIGIG